mgnify:CR=1 FL=1
MEEKLEGVLPVESSDEPSMVTLMIEHRSSRDFGRGANVERIANAFRIMLSDVNVKAVFINIFGGIVRCDRVAQGVVDAYKNIGNIHVPIIVRLQGTNAEIAKKLIDDSGLDVHSAITLQDAANKVIELVGTK